MSLEEIKTNGQILAEKLLFEPKNCWDILDAEDITKISNFADGYKTFLDRGKTEREFTAQCLDILNQQGFFSIEEILKKNQKLSTGDRVYQHIKNKSLIFAIIGVKPLNDGINILGAHVDSPRIDLKTNPLYEDTDFAFFDTHYYGGIKYYQWTTIPLAMHGIFFGKDGERKILCIGEDDIDPVFTITDLLPHLAKEQLDKKASEFINGEELDILVGSQPYKDNKIKDRVKLNLLNLLYKKYGITEKDFSSAEIEFVPAFKTKDVGLDQSMIGGYGHDDRCCAYAAFKALLNFATSLVPSKTVVCLLSDKEEIGSVGNTSIQSRLFENFIAYLCAKIKDSYSELYLRSCLSNSAMLSGDVNAAFDPNYASVYDKKTASYLGKGMVISKYTGHGGKFRSNDANAEFCYKVQRILNNHNIQWQYGNLGKVNKGGGGTIASYMANLGIDILDCGIPVLSMHSPFEVISKIDLYTTYKGYIAFLRDA
jgi:aspartyl aminopeptidase